MFDPARLLVPPPVQLSVQDNLQNFLITGQIGVGKSSTIGDSLMKAQMSEGYGFFAPCVKSDEADRVIGNAKSTARGKDIIHFSATSGHCFDPFFYEYARPGRAQNDAESLIDFLIGVISFGKPSGADSGDSRFFELASEQLSRHVINVLQIAGHNVSLVSMYQVISSLPAFPEQTQDPDWHANSYCGRLIKDLKARKDELTETQWEDLAVCSEFLLETWPHTDPKTTSNIAMTWKGIVDRFQFNPYRRIFASGKCSFIPEQTYLENKIIICDWPLSVYGINTARLINYMVARSFHRAWLRRAIEPDSNVVVFWCDEGDKLLPATVGGINPFSEFLSVSRSQRCSTTFIVQSLSAVASVLGEHSIGAKTKSFLSYFGHKIAFANSDTDSNEYYARLIGHEWRMIKGSSMSTRDAQISGSNQRVYRLEPDMFNRLGTPTPDSPFAEAVVIATGKTFENGENWIIASFGRE